MPSSPTRHLSLRRILLFIAATLFFAYLLSMARFGGVYTSYQPVGEESCTENYPLAGAEDFVSLPGEGILISAVDRQNHFPHFQDGIYWLANGGQPVLVSADAPSTFHPHGLSLYVDQAGERRLLYAVSHDGDLYGEDEGHSVEVFEFTRQHELKHLRSIRHPDIRSPNDLAVVGVDQFYISNDWYYLSGFMRVLEQYLLLPITNVVFYDNGETHEAASKLRYANGVTAALSGDGAHKLYVSEVMSRRINEYEINPETAALENRKQIHVGGSPDNISVDEEGRLIIAVIPDGFGFQAHAAGEAKSAPALIRRFNPASGELEDIFYTESGLISGATAGLSHDGKLFIGTAYDRVMLACKYEHYE